MTRKIRNIQRIQALFLVALMLLTVVAAGCGCASIAETVDAELTETTATAGDAEDTTVSMDEETTDMEETSEETSTEAEETEPEETTEEETTTAEEITTEEEPTAAATSGYTYSSMSKTMYVKQQVNVRSIPSKDGTKLGTLSAGTAVTVTGQCNETNWYRIEYNGSVGYVSNNYLTTTKPSTTTTTKTSETTTKKSSTNKTYSSMTEKLWDLGYFGYDPEISTGVVCYGSIEDYLTSAEITQLCQEYAEEVVELVNEERKAAGLWEYETNAKLTEAAQIRAEELTISFSHVRPNGTLSSTELWDVGLYSLNGTCENIAMGQTSPEQVMEDWMNSSGHRANILNDDYLLTDGWDGKTYESYMKEIGVGCYYKNGTFYWVQIFAELHTHTWDDEVSLLLLTDSIEDGISCYMCTNPLCGAYKDLEGHIHESTGGLDLSTGIAYDYEAIDGVYLP